MGFSSGKNAPNNVDLTSSQTLGNKTLDGSTVIQDGATITTPDIISPSRLDVKKDTLSNLQTYASSASNGQMCFATDTKQMFQVIDSALAEVSGGSGGINYVDNGDFDQDITGVTGSTNIIASQVTDSTKLRGDGSLKLAKAIGGDYSGQEVILSTFTIDRADLAKKLTISMDQDATHVGYNDGDARLRIKHSGSTYISINGEDIKGGSNSHIAQFQTDATVTTYSLVLEQVDTASIAYDLILDNIQVGPREVVKQVLQEENRFNALITNPSGTAAINNQSSDSYGDDWLDSATRASLGVVTVDYTSLGLSVAPDIQLTVLEAGGTSYYDAKVSSRSNTGATIVTHDNAGNRVDSGFYVTINRTGVDYKSAYQGSISEDLGQREVRVIGKGNGGASYTALTPIDFTEVEDTTASWDGSVFTVPETATYNITGNIRWNTNASRTIWASINGSEDFMLQQGGVSKGYDEFAQTVRLQKGDTYSIVSSASDTLSSIASHHWIHIEKLASPQTILETETVAASYVSEDGQTLGTGFEVLKMEIKHEDTHNAYNIATGIYTIPVSGYYIVSYGFAKSGATSRTRVDGKMQHLYANGDPLTNFGFGAGLLASTSSQDLCANGCVVRKFTKGDTVKVRGDVDSTAANLSTAEGKNYFSIAKVK